MIAVDSNIFIYWLERNPEFYTAAGAIITKIHAGATPASCSVLVLTEVYNGSPLSAEAITQLPGLSLSAVTQEIAELAGTIRQQYGAKVIDATHLASAIVAGADIFITNDKPLARLKLPNLKIQLLSAEP